MSDQTDAILAKDAKATELKQELTSFMGRAAAKYNDFVIYNTSNGLELMAPTS